LQLERFVPIYHHTFVFKRITIMKKTFVALVAVTAAVIALRQISQQPPVPGLPPHYGIQ
jgi:hypothetical protein